jgi:quercetin dioxygenase-like cupin family protein
MAFIDFNTVPEFEVWPGFRGRFVHTCQMTFGEVRIDAGAILPEHSHPHEQFTRVEEGTIEFTASGETHILTAGMTAQMHPHQPHSAKALTDVMVFDVFYPVREDFKMKTEQARRLQD